MMNYLNYFSVYDTNNIWGASSGALGNMEYPFIDIILRSTLTQNGSTY